MEKYIRAEMEIVKFDVEDVITTSGAGGNDPFEDYELPGMPFGF